MMGGIGMEHVVLWLAAGAAAWLVLSALLGKKKGQREFLREKPLRMEAPFPMYGKPDLVREEADGSLTICDLKNRARGGAYRADAVQLSCYSMLVRANHPGRKVNGSGVIILKRANGLEEEIPVPLLADEEIVRLRNRREDILDGRAKPTMCDGRLCGSCAFRGNGCPGASRR